MDIFIFVMLSLEIISMLTILIIGIVLLYFFINSGFMQNPPPVPTTGKVKTAMIDDVAKILAKHKNQTVMDLGSGWGTLLIPLAKKFPNHHFIGIEYGFVPYFISKFRTRKMHNIAFYRQDFWNTDISKADVIFLFLLNRLMSKMASKCQTQAKQGALIYVNRFPMPDIKPQKEVSLGSKFETYYVYKI